VYFVTVKQPGYCLFATTPSERFAIGLLDDQRSVRVLERAADGWAVVRELPVAECSHTDLMLRLGAVDEPASAAELLRLAGAA
jgi:hypothetical protein